MSRFANYANFVGVDEMEPTQRASQYSYNGRIFFAPDEFYPKYDLYKDSSKQQTIDTSIIRNIVMPNEVSRTFFSDLNQEKIQKAIIEKVYNVCEKRISKQSYSELQIIMKSIYLQYSKNLPNNIEKQVIDLNNMVINECVNRIVPNILQYIGYLKDISSPIPVMALPQSTTDKGSKTYDLSSNIPSTIY
jgi:hypothetical protein